MLTRPLLFAFAACQLEAAITLNSQLLHVETNGIIESAAGVGALSESVAYILNDGNSSVTASAFADFTPERIFISTTADGWHATNPGSYAIASYSAAFTLTGDQWFRVDTAADGDWGFGNIPITIPPVPPPSGPYVPGVRLIWEATTPIIDFGQLGRPSVRDNMLLPAGNYTIEVVALAGAGGGGDDGGGTISSFVSVFTMEPISPVPEPSTLLLASIGLLLARSRRIYWR